MWNFRRKKKNRLGVSPKTVKTVLTGEVPDNVDLELNTKTIPEIDVKLETKTVKAVVKNIDTTQYVEPTHKEIIEGLEICDNYEAAFLIKDLKRKNASLKRKLTIAIKKSNGYKEDLDKANAALKQLLKKDETL